MVINDHSITNKQAQTHLVDQQVYHFLNTLLDGLTAGFENKLGIGGSLVILVHTGKPFYLACACPFVQSFDIALLTDLDWRVDEALDKLEVVILVNLASVSAVIGERTNYTDQGNRAGIGKESCHLCDASNVLTAIVLAKAETLVESMTDVVPI